MAEFYITTSRNKMGASIWDNAFVNANNRFFSTFIGAQTFVIGIQNLPFANAKELSNYLSSKLGRDKVRNSAGGSTNQSAIGSVAQISSTIPFNQIMAMLNISGNLTPSTPIVSTEQGLLRTADRKRAQKGMELRQLSQLSGPARRAVAPVILEQQGESSGLDAKRGVSAQNRGFGNEDLSLGALIAFVVLTQ